MPKRKHRNDEEQLEFLAWKVKKLERKLGQRRRSRSKSKQRDRSRSHSGSQQRQSRDSSSLERQDEGSAEMEHTSYWDILETSDELVTNSTTGEKAPIASEPVNAQPENEVTPMIPIQSIDPPNKTTTADDTHVGDEPDNDILEILGLDPSATIEYGKEIHKELASRLQHIATTGLTKESRKELITKYLVPENCAKIGAPKLNPEIKAALTEPVVKRDKGIEGRQKELASAISGLAELLNRELQSKDKDSTRLKQLMDVCRILCDIQHAESVTRRNFAIFSIKKELKEHLVDTKIDKTLFGEDLADTLKSAKAVSKSGSELKTKPPPRPKSYAATTSNLNWKSPAPARKQPYNQRSGAPPPRTTAPAAPGSAARSSRNTTHASSSKPSHYPPKQTHRR